MPRVFYLRHAESTANNGIFIQNAPLSELGREQAKDLQGIYDYVICSSLKRTRQTLELSNIRYNELFVLHNIREYDDHAHEEPRPQEKNKAFKKRILKFEKDLREFCKTCKPETTILIVGHGWFYLEWIGDWSEFPNAEIREIAPEKYLGPVRQ